jgi:hypothetical protein
MVTEARLVDRFGLGWDVADSRYRRAARYLRRAADSGIPPAAADLALLLNRRGRWAELRAWYRRTGDLARAQEVPAVEAAQYYVRVDLARAEKESLRPT